jgi:integrase
MPIKRAKVLDEDQVRKFREFIATKSRHAERDDVMVLLSFSCGLRSCEISGLKWKDVTDACGEILPPEAAIELPHNITKFKVQYSKVYMHPALWSALKRLKELDKPTEHLMYARFAKSGHMSVNNVTVYFKQLYQRANLGQCSSHSGRRTFITDIARRAGAHECSIKDVQIAARHSDIKTTERYIEESKRLVKLVASAGYEQVEYERRTC